jgi:hypothetical protein
MTAPSSTAMPALLCPGASRIILADKYLAAARMSEIGLSQWEALALMRQGFIRVFLPSADRLIFDLCATPVP